MKKLEKLHLAAQVAPVLRDRIVRSRRVKVYDHETGELLRETTLDLVKLAENQLLRAGIEIDLKVTPGRRPKALRCACGMPFIVPSKGHVNKYCSALCRERQKIESRRMARRRYNVSKAGKEARRRYNESKAGKEARRRFDASENRKEAKRRLFRSEARKEARRMYDASKAGKEARRRYDTSEARKEARRRYRLKRKASR